MPSSGVRFSNCMRARSLCQPAKALAACAAARSRSVCARGGLLQGRAVGQHLHAGRGASGNLRGLKTQADDELGALAMGFFLQAQQGFAAGSLHQGFVTAHVAAEDVAQASHEGLEVIGREMTTLPQTRVVRCEAVTSGGQRVENTSTPASFFSRRRMGSVVALLQDAPDDQPPAKAGRAAGQAGGPDRARTWRLPLQMDSTCTAEP